MTLNDRLADAVATGGTAQQLAEAIITNADAVHAVANTIHELAETAFEEHGSVAAITALMEAEGWSVERGIAGLDTAFIATSGNGSRRIDYVAEYDALPGIGHACGHNLIAGASIQAALALGSIADELDITVRLVGTPAEEHGAGKVPMLDAGVFDATTAALMVHTVPQEIRMDPVGTSSQAVGRFRATFTGVAAHAAAAPHRAINAADAATIAQVAIGLLRQQVPEDHRIASFVSHGGEVTNIIPSFVTLDFECRAFTMEEFTALKARVEACIHAGALATGATVTIEPTEPTYEPLVQDEQLGASWREAMELAGFDLDSGIPLGGGSTDMGNVSRKIPGLHPWVPLPGVTHAIHTADFAAAAATDSAYLQMHLAGFGLAVTGAQAARA